MSPEPLLPFLLLALGSGLHCLGMCGGFVVALTSRARRSRRVTGRGLWFALGKATTYSILGVTLALAASPLRADARALGGVLAWVAGGALILLGLGRLGLRWPAELTPSSWSRLLSPVRAAYGRVASLPGYAGPLGAGLLAGALPCGVSWGALALATTASPVEAAAGMFVFGLATTPALLVAALGVRGATSLPVLSRKLGGLLMGGLLILLGLWTGLRGGLPGNQDALLHRELLPACCTETAP